MKKEYNVAINKTSVSSIFERTPETVALLSKMVTDEKKYKHDRMISGKLSPHSKRIRTDMQITENILELFPDVELGLNMLISAALQPHDLATTIVNYTAGELLPPDINSVLLKILKTEIDGHYPVVNTLDTIAERCVLGKGSDVYVVVAENIIDMIINGEGDYIGKLNKHLYDSNGSIKDFGILGTKSTEGYEEVSSFGIESTDNFTLLSAKRVHDLSLKKARSVFTNTIGGSGIDVTAGLEGSKLTIVQNAVYKNVQGDDNKEIDLKPMRMGSRESIGRCTVFRPTPESTIVVHRPGEPEAHVGYFILYGENGYPINASDDASSGDKNPYKGLAERFKNSVVGKKIQVKATKKFGGSKAEFEKGLKYYTEVVENYLLKRLNEGYQVDDSVLGDQRDVYQIMLARTLAGRKTKIVFVPFELCTYFAVDYKDDGTGINKVTKLCKLASIRAKLLYTKLHSEIRKGIRNTNVTIALDPNDPDPSKTIEILQADILETRQLDKTSIDTVDPKIITSFLHKAGVSFNYTNHPGLPQVAMTFEDSTIEGQPIDTEYSNDIKEAMLNRNGVTSELIDGGLSPDFASSMEARRNGFMKRAMIMRTKLTGHQTHLVKSIALNDKIIQTKLLEVISNTKNIKSLYNNPNEKELEGDELNNDILLNWIDSVDISVIDTNGDADTKVLSEQYRTYKDALLDTIESWVSRDLLAEVDIDTQDVEHLVQVLSSYFLRKWQTDNGFMVELGDICTRDSGGNPVMKLDKLVIEHTESLLNTIGEYIKKTKPKEEDGGYGDGGGYGDDTGVDDTSGDDTGGDDTGGDVL
jgi:hypothetical protein